MSHTNGGDKGQSLLPVPSVATVDVIIGDSGETYRNNVETEEKTSQIDTEVSVCQIFRRKNRRNERAEKRNKHGFHFSLGGGISEKA